MPLIVIEGTDGVGKTRLRDQLAYRLALLDYKVIQTSEPWHIDEHLDLASCSPLEQLFLFQADRVSHCQFIREYLAKGYVIVCDRYTASTVAYQGYGHGLSLDLIHQTNQAATGGLKADLTLWLDMPVEKALARSKMDALDSYDLEFYERVRRGYAADYSLTRVDADKSPEEVEAEVWTKVEALLKPQTSADLNG